MSEIKLSKRLAAIAKLVPQSGGAADIGTDHGLIAVWLCLRGQERVIAADINREPLEHARQTAKEHACEEIISFVLCNGLESIDESAADSIIIAGMGGELIADILAQAPWSKKKTLILQPMTKADELRKWLFESGYKITHEELVFDGRLYEIITATGGEDLPYSPAEYLTGHHELIAGDPLFPQRLDGLTEKLRRAIAGLESAAADQAERLHSQRELLDELLKMQSGAGGEK